MNIKNLTVEINLSAGESITVKTEKGEIHIASGQADIFITTPDDSSERGFKISKTGRLKEVELQ